jgi:chaperonin cofactor prefoldin
MNMPLSKQDLNQIREIVVDVVKSEVFKAVSPIYEQIGSLVTKDELVQFESKINLRFESLELKLDKLNSRQDQLEQQLHANTNTLQATQEQLWVNVLPTQNIFLNTFKVTTTNLQFNW